STSGPRPRYPSTTRLTGPRRDPTRMQLKTRLGAACALAMTLALAGCSDPAPERGAAAAETVTTDVVRMQAWNDTLRALGTVQARESRSEEHTSELQSRENL